MSRQKASNATLGDFLRACRARVNPTDAGLPDDGRHRRVPGLRREELAQLANVSVDYVVRLEHGRTVHVSTAVLGAGGMRDWADSSNHAQDGDPVKAAAAIITVARAARMPARIPLGKAGLADVQDKLDGVARELETWRDLALSTDFTA